jgi:hypothetical protein
MTDLTSFYDEDGTFLGAISDKLLKRMGLEEAKESLLKAKQLRELRADVLRKEVGR